MILRTIRCDICGQQYTEKSDGSGFPGWGALQGIKLDDTPNPSLCPEHLAAMADHLDSIKDKFNGLD